MLISNEGKAISERFFHAIEILKSQKRIRGLKTFAVNNGHDVWHLQMLKNGMDIRVLKPEYIHTICKEYNISPEWIILGTGQMFRCKNE